MNIKQIIVNTPGFKTVNKYRQGREFNRDRALYNKYSIREKGNNEQQIEYLLLMEAHKLEKGFNAANMRPFGAKKIKKILEILEQYESVLKKRNSFALEVIESMLLSYKKLYEQKKWTSYEQYELVCNYLKTHKIIARVEYGSIVVPRKDLKNNYEAFMNLLKTRHSTRAFSDEPVTEEEIKKAIEAAKLSPSACNRQPCKVYFIKTEECQKVLTNVLPGYNLFEMDNTKTLLVTFDMSFVSMIGERNQGWFNAGLFAMNLVNALHAEGIGTCFLQWGEKHSVEEKVKEKLDIPKNERIAVAIACGHYKDENKVLCSARRSAEEMFKVR